MSKDWISCELVIYFDSPTTNMAEQSEQIIYDAINKALEENDIPIGITGTLLRVPKL
jgi:hypothetical protein